MTITKEISYNHTIDEEGDIQVQRITTIMEDGVEIAQNNHRHVVHPGDDTTNEDERTKGYAGLVHKKALIDKYKERVAKGLLKTTNV
jgi:hypothetical protein